MPTSGQMLFLAAGEPWPEATGSGEEGSSGSKLGAAAVLLLTRDIMREE